MTLKYQAEALVLTARDAGSTDKIVTLFSREYGKLVLIAHGVRKSKKRASGSLLPFAHLDVLIAKAKGLDTLEQWAGKTSFHALSQDLDKMSYASFLSELAAELFPEREVSAAAFDALLRSFQFFLNRNPRLTALAGALKLISLAGLEAVYHACVHCGQLLCADEYFDPLAGGAVCSTCAKGQHLRRLTPKMRQAIFLLEGAFAAAAPQFTVSAKTLAEVEALIIDYLYCHLDLGRELKSLSFIRKMNSFG
jgi:DNA repair protein RecO (recombination protein O)